MADDLQEKYRFDEKLEKLKFSHGYELQEHVNRQGAFVQFIRGLFLLHGGGVAALLVFLQSMWDKSPALSKSIVWGIFVLCIGLSIAGVLHLLRNFAARKRAVGDRPAMEGYSTAYVSLGIMSLAMFPLGVAIVAVGALLQLYSSS